MKNIVSYISESLFSKEVFVVLKPGSLDLAQTIIERFEKDGWKIVQTTTKTLLLQEAKELYKVHKKEPFYEDLCNYMSSGPCRAFIFRNPDSEKPFTEVKVIKEEIRNEYGESDMRNVLHSSDSRKAMEHEASIFFTLT